MKIKWASTSELTVVAIWKKLGQPGSSVLIQGGTHTEEERSLGTTGVEGVDDVGQIVVWTIILFEWHNSLSALSSRNGNDSHHLQR
jgi:hypothetical protein